MEAPAALLPRSFRPRLAVRDGGATRDLAEDPPDARTFAIDKRGGSRHIPKDAITVLGNTAKATVEIRLWGDGGRGEVCVDLAESGKKWLLVNEAHAHLVDQHDYPERTVWEEMAEFNEILRLLLPW